MADEMTFRQQVAARAAYQCEYCRLSERYTSVPFQVDHVIAEKHEGKTSLENLAYACLHCNAFKGPNIAGRDPVTNEIVRLFDPRRDSWDEHFEWEGPVLKARTAIGRVTVAVLRINLPYRVAVRASHMEEGLF
jgi:hypothetical protein